MLLSILRGFFILIGLSLVSFVAASGQAFSVDPARKSLPDRLGEFRAVGAVESLNKELVDENDRISTTSWASRRYVSKDGRRFSVLVSTASSDSVAYSKLMNERMAVEKAPEGQDKTSIAYVGTAAFSYWNGLNYNLDFFKGRVFASVRGDGKSSDLTSVTSFSQTLAETLEPGEGDIPVLIKHLPDWQNVQHRVEYVVTQVALKDAFRNQLVFDVVSLDGGSEAVIANYNGPQLVVIEFNTPQLATDTDSRITARLQELRNQGQPVPTAYRRVGNYSVFVFDAPSEQAANQLIDQVKYQQLVQWLGRNPNLYDAAVREFAQTTLGVLVNVVKGSGLALVSCLALGDYSEGSCLFAVERSRVRLKRFLTPAGCSGSIWTK